MYNFYNTSVNESEYGRFFDEEFNMKDFAINFHSDENDAPFGAIHFQPVLRKATAIIYWSAEDLSATYNDIDLRSFMLGQNVIAYFEDYNFSEMYNYAMEVTKSYVNDLTY